MYQALYRKWRPSTFDDVYGQPHVTRTLKNELQNNRISHAYLFTGSRGTGKTTCAKILSKAVNCLNPVNGNPCNECEICKGIDNGSVLDVIEIDAASNNGVDNIRDLREEANFTPASSKYRVYIVDEVHMLSTGAFNALLKTLEEPPAHVMFILATTEIHKLPATILSRCQRFDFKRISPDDITARLLYVSEKENVKLTENAASLIARIADGGMRDALSLLDRCFAMSSNIDEDTVSSAAGIAGTVHLFSFSEYIINNDFSAALELVSKLYNESCDIDSLCTELILHFRNLMVTKTVKDCSGLIVCSQDELQKLRERADKLRLSKILDCINILEQTSKNIKNSSNKKIQFESAVIKMCGNEFSGSASSDPEIEKRISAIEEKLDTLIKKGSITVLPQNSEKQSEPVYTKKQEQTEETQPETDIQPPLPEEPVTEIRDGEFINWSEVLQKLESCDMPLFGIMTGSTATIKNGRVCISSENPTLFDFICENTVHSKFLSRSIYEVLGKKMKIMVASKENKQAAKNPLEQLKTKIDNFNNNN